MPSAATPVVVGRVHGLFGVSGWVKAYSYTRPYANLLEFDDWLIGGADNWRSYRVLDARVQGKTLIAKLGDAYGHALPDRDAAAALLGQDIAVPRADMPALAAHEFYWVDLVGLTVCNRQQQHLGCVVAMMETGGNDVLVVRGERERLIPFVVGEFVDRVDIDARQIMVDWGIDF